MKKTKWLQKTHLLRADEYICPVYGAISDKPRRKYPSCGTALYGTAGDSTWVDEAEGLSAIMDVL